MGQITRSIRIRLILSYLVLLVLFSVVSVFSILNMQDSEKVSRDIDDRYTPGLAIIAELHGDVQDSERNVLRLILETDPKEKEKLQKELTELLASIASQRQSYEALIPNEEADAAYRKFAKDYDAYLQGVPAVLQALPNGQAAALTAFNQYHPSFLLAAQELDDIIQVTDRIVSDVTAQSVADSRFFKWLAVWLTSGSILLGIVMAVLIANRMAGPLVQLSSRTRKIAEGDLTVSELETNREDEIGRLILDFNTMVRSLREVMGQVSMNAHQVAATSEEMQASAEQTSRSSEEIASSIQEIASGTDQQARSAAESSRASGDMSKGMEQISVSIQNVAASSNEASDQAVTGNRLIEDAVTQMQVIQDKVAAAAETVHQLGARSEQIDGIVKSITSIAQQTNLLALNAGIEAARAGEQGKGFAVVASEVRKLAEQSSSSADLIRQLLEEMKVYTERAIAAAQQGTAAVSDGILAVHEAGRSFRGIAERVTSVSGQAQEASAVVQQLHGGTQVMLASIQQIAKVSEQAADNTQQIAAATEEQSASMEQVAASSQALAKMAEELQLAVSRFKL